MGDLTSHFEADVVVDYADIPHFPRTTAPGHKGRLVCGTLAGSEVVAMDGRFHIYEGHSPERTTLPVHLAHQLGAELLIVVSAAGGLSPRYTTGDVVVIVDHINRMCGSPLAAQERPHECGYYQRDHYDAALAEQALRIARQENFMAHRGVYVAMTGPNYETRAEYRFLRQIGGDVVGMSTVPEVIAASQCGMRVLALSTVTNLSRPDAPQKVTATEVLQTACRAEPHIRKIIQGVLAEQLGG